MINTDKQKETNLLIKLADKIDNPELKLEYLLKLKDLITNEPSTSISQPYTLKKIFQRFENSSTQELTLQDLQKEIKDTKQELQKFKQKTKKQITNLEQILLQKHLSSSSSDKKIEQIDQGETSTKFINLIERITYQKWHVNITVTIQDSFKLQTIALIDSGAQMNCIQEGLIPTKYFEKTKQKLSTANGENLRVNFKVTDVHICNEGICIKQSFILVKDLDIGIILGQPFLEIIKPFKVTNEGITTKLFQQKIMFAFNEKPITKDINLLKTFSLVKEHSVNIIETKENHLQQELSNKKFEHQLQTSQRKEKIDSLKINIIKNICSDLPNVFWHRKRHMASLPYENNFAEQNILTKIKSIQITHELMKYCEKDIQELLNKKLIGPNKSPLNHATIYKNSGTPKFIINYKPINIRHSLTKSDLIIHCEWSIMLFYAPRKIMNEIFIPFSIDDILTILKEQYSKYSYTFYKIIQTNDLSLSKQKINLFITHDRFLGIITYNQKSILFHLIFPDVATDRKQLPIIIYIDSLFLNTNQNCQQAFSRLEQKKESIKDTLSPTEIKKNTSDTLSPTETRIRFLKRNKTFQKLLQNIFPFVLHKKESFKTTLSPTEVKITLFPTTMKTLSIQKSFTDKLLFNNSSHTYLDHYKRDSFHIRSIPYRISSFHSFIKTPQTMETLSSDRATKKKKFPSPTEIEKSKSLSLTEIEIRNSRAFFFPNTIFKQLRDYNLEGVVETIQEMRRQNLFNNFQVIQNFLRHILSNPQQYPIITTGNLSYYFPKNQQIQCPKILDTCQSIPIDKYSCTCHLAYTIYTACWDLSGPKEYIFQNKIITPQFLMDHGMLQQVVFSDLSHFQHLGRKIKLIGLDLMVRGFQGVQATITSTPPEFIHSIKPARHLIQIQGYNHIPQLFPHLIQTELWDCSRPLQAQVRHWAAKTITTKWNHCYLPFSFRLIAEDHIQKIYSTQSHIHISLADKTDCDPLIDIIKKEMIENTDYRKTFSENKALNNWMM
ncbi:hypothetical protein CFOL_v3_24377 [Cephalotus follicularis]|uniref:Retropepsins domain-containing protein n=1 Tax=Cephalotus follicularis TaxID=3775 RepID=A0A1Q3CLH5_CEPFO|nr:hypothetical protein CFOL_v3_24377 [Cephalotus follicularis]